MNLYEKMNVIKMDLLKSNLKKSGENKFAGFKYYELADFLPTIIELCSKHNVFTSVSFDKENAKLTIINCEAPEETLTYTSPMEELELKGCNKIQALGGTETYSRRYLYMAAFDIIENDMFDSTTEQNEINTLEEAEKYVLTFGKYNGRLLKEICEEDDKYINWLFGSEKTDEVVKKCITLLTGKVELSDEEEEEKLTLMASINTLVALTGSDFEKIREHYKVKSTADMTIEQLKDCKANLEKKKEKEGK